MSFRVCVGTCPDCGRQAWSLWRPCLPAFWRKLFRKYLGSGGMPRHGLTACERGIDPRGKAEPTRATLRQVWLDLARILDEPAPKSFSLLAKRKKAILHFGARASPLAAAIGQNVLMPNDGSTKPKNRCPTFWGSTEPCLPCRRSYLVRRTGNGSTKPHSWICAVRDQPEHLLAEEHKNEH